MTTKATTPTPLKKITDKKIIQKLKFEAKHSDIYTSSDEDNIISRSNIQ